MDIKEITRYIVDGQEFRNLTDVQKYTEDKIGKVIDKIRNACPLANAKDAIKMFDILTEKETRDILLKYLNIIYIDERESSLQPHHVNILDLYKNR